MKGIKFAHESCFGTVPVEPLGVRSDIMQCDVVTEPRLTCTLHFHGELMVEAYITRSVVKKWINENGWLKDLFIAGEGR